MSSRDLLATGFIADVAGEGSLFPSAGGTSDEAKVQAVYWRCIAVMMYSARLNNPNLRLALFSNVAAPVVSGVDMNRLLDQLGVEQIRLPLQHRLPAERARSWGNVFYILDILPYVDAASDIGRFVLLDSDVITTSPLDGLFDAISRDGFVGYERTISDDFNVNGLSSAQIGELSEASGGSAGPALIFGGELLGVDIDRYRRERDRLDALWQEVLDGDGGMSAVRTEEHFWSLYFARHDVAPLAGNQWIKRMWTARNHWTVAPGDEALALWHLPAEKRFGFVDLFYRLRASNFSPVLSPDQFRAMAQRACGVPKASWIKRMRDDARRLQLRVFG